MKLPPIALEARFRGVNVTAAPRESGGRSKITDALGGIFEPVSGPIEIGSILDTLGDGARGIVLAGRPNAPDGSPVLGHAFNVVNQDGGIAFLDSQPGKNAGLFSDSFEQFESFSLLITAGGE